MKKKIILLGTLILLASSCVVKSLHPFFLEKHIKNDGSLVGSFQDEQKGSWKITKWIDAVKADSSYKVDFSTEGLGADERFLHTYIISYKKKGLNAEFIATPFMVGESLMLDLTPFEYQTNAINELAAQHLLKTHSVALVEQQNKGMVLKFLSDDIIRDLLSQQKLRISHEKTGVDDDLILTANSEELYAFLLQFLKSDQEEKWDKDDMYTLSPKDA